MGAMDTSTINQEFTVIGDFITYYQWLFDVSNGLLLALLFKSDTVCWIAWSKEQSDYYIHRTVAYITLLKIRHAPQSKNHTTLLRIRKVIRYMLHRKAKSKQQIYYAPVQQANTSGAKVQIFLELYCGITKRVGEHGLQLKTLRFFSIRTKINLVYCNRGFILQYTFPAQDWLVTITAGICMQAI